MNLITLPTGHVLVDDDELLDRFIEADLEERYIDLPPAVREAGFGEALAVSHHVHDGQHYTLIEVSGAYENPEPTILLGRLTPEEALAEYEANVVNAED